jgi:hypothetical protein
LDAPVPARVTTGTGLLLGSPRHRVGSTNGSYAWNARNQLTATSSTGPSASYRGHVVIEEHVTRALLSVMMILADAAESGADSYRAVNALETIAAELGEMEEAERSEFVDVLERIAADAPAEQADWIRAVPRRLGLDVG